MSAIFPELPDSVSSEFVTVTEGVELRVLRAGSGDPVLFIPGWNYSAEVFVHQLTELAQHYEVLAVDPRGHGKSSKPLTGNNYPQRGRDLDALIEALGLKNLTLAGWSLGVLDALSYLRDHGHDRVAKLMLIDETPKMAADPANPEEWGEVPLTHDGMPAFILFLSTDRDGFLSYISADALGVDPELADQDEATRRLIADGAQTPEHIAIIAGVEGFATDVSQTAIDFERSGKPVLFFAKEAWANDAKRWVSANLPSAQFATMPVHAGFMTEPAAFNARVREFIG